MSSENQFKLTYATMFNPPEELHARFDSALQKIKSSLGKEQAMFIDGKDYLAGEKFEDRNPANTDEVLGGQANGRGFVDADAGRFRHEASDHRDRYP